MLERGGWIAPEMAAVLRDMVGFRNVLVHGYDTVNLEVVEDVMRNHLGDLVLIGENGKPYLLSPDP